MKPYIYYFLQIYYSRKKSEVIFVKSKIILISIFLLAICMITPLAAADNSTVDSPQTADNINVSFDEMVYEKDLGEIDVELPENTSGNLKATINDVEFYNENVSSSVKIPITIPKEAISHLVVNKNTDHVTYHINLFFDNVLINSSHTLKVMKVNPNFTVPGFPEEILKDDPQGYVSFYMPESANGEMKIYIDDKFAFNFTSRQYNIMNASDFNSLDLGDHNVTVVYAGDAYYRKFNKTFNFTVVDMLINIPKTIVLDHDDCISTKILNNTDGIVTIYIDGQMVFKDKLDKRGEFLHSLFNDITCGPHMIDVQYNASKFSKSKRELVEVYYYVDMFGYGPYVYGEDNEYTIIVPVDFKKDLIEITIDGVRYTDFEIDNSGWIELDISKLDVGNHQIEFFYPADEKYYSYVLRDNFTVGYEIQLPYDFFRETEFDVTLKLPKSAKGSLEVYVDSELYKRVKLDGGSAVINVNDLIPASYNVSARYTGTDFNVSDVNSIIDIYPDITTPGEMYCGEDKSIVVKTLKEAKGNVIFKINGQNITVELKDGKAKLPLKSFKVGYYDDIDAVYVGDNGYNATLYSAVEILPSVKLSDVKVTSEKAKMKVLINGKTAKNTNVNFKVDGKAKKVKTDKNGIATFKLAAGKHKITAVYKSSKATKTVNVHVITLKSVTPKKSAKKVVLTAKLKKGKTLLKNKAVTFKFNGKTLKVKTNSKGIAKATFKTSGLKVGKKVTYQAKYGKDTVKKTATVKK